MAATPQVCQVPACEAPLADAKPYHRKHRVCAKCAKADFVAMVDAQMGSVSIVAADTAPGVVMDFTNAQMRGADLQSSFMPGALIPRIRLGEPYPAGHP